MHVICQDTEVGYDAKLQANASMVCVFIFLLLVFFRVTNLTWKMHTTVPEYATTADTTTSDTPYYILLC